MCVTSSACFETALNRPELDSMASRSPLLAASRTISLCIMLGNVRRALQVYGRSEHSSTAAKNFGGRANIDIVDNFGR
jgi:hypothetical protein